MSEREDIPPWAREDPRHQFRLRVACYGVAVLRGVDELSDEIAVARLRARFGEEAATAWYRACAVETRTLVVEWSS